MAWATAALLALVHDGIGAALAQVEVVSAAELQGLQDAGRGPARSGSRLGQNEYGRVMEVGASNRQPLRRGTPGEAEPVAPDSGAYEAMGPLPY